MSARTAHALIPAFVVLAALPAPAGADWSPPEPVSAPGADALVSLGFDRRGQGIMAWSAQPGRLSYTATRPPGGVWAAPRLLPRSISYAGFTVQPYARARALMVAKVRGGEGRRGVRYRIATALGTAAGDFGRFSALDRGRTSSVRRASDSLSIPVLAANARGDATAAWMRHVGGVAAVRVATRVAGRPFSRPRTIGRAQPFRTAVYQSGYRVPAGVAIDARGNRVVAWYHGRRIKARIRRAGGRWGTVQQIGRASHPPPTITTAAAAARGRFLVTWGTLTQSRDQRVFEHSTAALRPRGGRWTTSRLERFATAPGAPFASAERQVAAVFDSTGRAVTAWTGALAGHPGVNLATSRGLRFGPAQVMSGALHAARLGGLAAGPAGRLAVSFTQDTGTAVVGRFPWVRVGSGAEGFGPAELVGHCAGSPLCSTGDVVRIAFDPVSAQPTAAWTERTDAGSVVFAASRR